MVLADVQRKAVEVVTVTLEALNPCKVVTLAEAGVPPAGVDVQVP